MKVALLHQDLEWSEKQLKKEFESRGLEVTLLNIDSSNFSNINNYDLVLNRVYASVANRDFTSVVKTLDLLNSFEASGAKCINSYFTSKFDYSKLDAFKVLSKNGIYTPDTIEIINVDSTIDSFIEKHDFPLILKRNTGGRGKDVLRINSREELVSSFENVTANASKENYTGKFILQELVRSNRDYDCRIAIIDDQYVLSYYRTLISAGAEDNWLASVSRGSTMGDYSPSNNEIEVAKSASRCIGSMFNEVDMIFTDKGPCIIENNPTPNYDVGEEERVKLAVENILKTINRG